MPVRGTRLAGRLLEGAVDHLHERAPDVSERVYRTVAGPLLLADPAAAARAAETRLDGTRQRVTEMATKGSLPAAGVRRVRRDLARTRADVECIAPRLPVVQARHLAQRSSAYTDVLQRLSDKSQRSDPAWNVFVLIGALSAWIGLLLWLTSPVVAGLVGLAGGVSTAVVLTGAHARKVGRERIGAIAQALAQADAGVAPLPVARLDRDHRALSTRARTCGRLDERGLAALGAIDAHLDDLLVRLMEGELQGEGVHLVQATVERYLPDTLEPFLALPDGQTLVRERPAAQEVADQLSAIEAGLAELVRRPRRNTHEQQLLLQGEFLRSKFGSEQGRQ